MQIFGRPGVRYRPKIVSWSVSVRIRSRGNVFVFVIPQLDRGIQSSITGSFPEPVD